MDEPGRRRVGGYQVSYGEADQEGGETRSQMEEKKPVIDRIIPHALIPKKLEIEISIP